MKTGRGYHYFSFESFIISSETFILEMRSLRGISSMASHCSVLTCWISPNDHSSFKTSVICANLCDCNLFSIICCLRVDDQTVIAMYSWANWIVMCSYKPTRRSVSWLCWQESYSFWLSPFQQQPCCICLRKQTGIRLPTWNLGIRIYLNRRRWLTIFLVLDHVPVCFSWIYMSY